MPDETEDVDELLELVEEPLTGPIGVDEDPVGPVTMVVVLLKL